MNRLKDNNAKKGVKVSVVMCILNGEKYIGEAIESILNQTFKDFEFIIIDDGSTDRTSDIVNSYDDERIILLTNKNNQGISESSNRGIRESRGHYIARHDHDDISEKTRLEEQYKFLEENHDVGIVGSNYMIINENGEVSEVVKPPHVDSEIREQMMRGDCFCHGAVMFRKSLINEIGYYRGYFKSAEDYDLFMRGIEVMKGANLDRNLYKLRRGVPSLSRDVLDMQLNYALIIIELAKRRKKTGYDCLRDIEHFSLDKALAEYLKVDKNEIVNFKEAHIKYFYEQCVRSGNLVSVIKVWLRFFKNKPQKWKIKYLFKTLILGKRCS